MKDAGDEAILHRHPSSRVLHPIRIPLSLALLAGLILPGGVNERPR